MPRLQLRSTYTYAAEGGLWLYSPKPSRTLADLRQHLQAQGAIIVWSGTLATVREYQVLHWVEEQRTVAGSGSLGYRDYQVSQASGYEGYGSAVESLYSAVVAMLPKGAEIGRAQVLVVREAG